MNMVEILEKLEAKMERLLNFLPKRKRLYFENLEKFENERGLLIYGPRGVGKTTYLLIASKKHNFFYLSGDDPLLSYISLYELSERVFLEGFDGIIVDEVHYLNNWSLEIKSLYDFFPDKKIWISDSSSIILRKGISDLSRRFVKVKLPLLSFREYLELFHHIASDVYTLQDILIHRVSISGLNHPLPLFQDYLRQGYYPFVLENEYELRLQQMINQTLESDIPQYADMNVATGRKLRQLLGIIARSVPFKPNFSNIARMLGASRNNIADYLLYMEEAGLIAQLRDATNGIRGLGKISKVYLDNTNLIYNLAQNASDTGNIRETFFFNQTRVLFDVIASPLSDFLIDDTTFEVGGKNKRQKQIKGIDKSFVVKDDIESGFMNIIPLWQFGLLY